MKIENRDNSLTYNFAIKRDKTKLVLDWLHEFRFSSIDIIAKRIGAVKTNYTSRFIKLLIDEGLIRTFTNVHTSNCRYVMLTAEGVSYLESLGRDVSRANTRVQQLGHYSKILHDIGIQEAVLERLEGYDEVIWDKNIQLDGFKLNEHPDALMHSTRGFWVALEYERWRKEQRRIYISFMNHVRALTEKKYNGVYFIFNKEVDRDYYQKLFDQAEWPRFKREESGRIKSLSTTFKPDEVQNLRRCFVFTLEGSSKPKS